MVEKPPCNRKHSKAICHFTGDRCQTALHGRKFSHFHIVSFSVRKGLFHYPFFPLLGPYLVWFLKFVIYPEIAISFSSKMVFQVRWAKCLAPFQTLNQCDQILLLQVIMTLLSVWSLFKNNSWNTSIDSKLILWYSGIDPSWGNHADCQSNHHDVDNRSAGKIFSFFIFVNGALPGTSVIFSITGSWMC